MSYGKFPHTGFLLAVVFLVACGQSSRDLFSQGERLMNQKEWEQAIGVYEKILPGKPEYTSAQEQMIKAQNELTKQQLEQGQGLMDKNEWEQAITVYGKILSKEPGNAQAKDRLARAESELKIKSLRQSIIGDWNGDYSIVTYAGERKSMGSVHIRIRDDGTLQFQGDIGRELGNSARTYKYKFDLHPIRISKETKDDFGDVKHREEILAYPFDAKLSTCHVRFLVFQDEKNITLYSQKLMILDKFLYSDNLEDIPGKMELARDNP